MIDENRTPALSEGEKIEDLMLGGYKIIQSDKLYRFTSDSVILSRFASVRSGERVADLMSGSGIVGLHYYALHSSRVKSVDLFELQPELADMSRKSVRLNGLDDVFTVHDGAVQNAPASLNGTFSLALCNPPYEKASLARPDMPYTEAVCKYEIEISLDQLCLVARRLLKNGGRFALCSKSERTADVFSAFSNAGLNPSRLAFVAGKNDKPYLMLVEGVKGGNPRLAVEPQIRNDAIDFSGNNRR